ncbi:hypothetical protein ACP70R_002751 [Stipagrostis hirtigluma subsp. patula]
MQGSFCSESEMGSNSGTFRDAAGTHSPSPSRIVQINIGRPLCPHDSDLHGQQNPSVFGPSTMASPTSPASPSRWSDLLPELLGCVIALLTHPADHARFRAVCRAWHSAMRHHLRQQAPWIVFPDGSFGTVGDGASYFGRLPGLPENVTCIGGTDDWLALDCTDDVLRRTSRLDESYFHPRRDVKHRHTYMLYNPFSGKTVPLPELDSIIGDVAETFEIRKVLMRTNSPDDVIAVMTSSWKYNIILCRPGKGKWVLPDFRVCDVAFLGDRLYGINPEEELIAFDLAEDDDGRPTVTKSRRVIRKPLAIGEDDQWSWMYNDNSEEDDDNDDTESSGEESNQEEDSFNDDGEVSDGVDRIDDEEVAYEPKDMIVITRRLVKSRNNGELLMVRHHRQVSPFFDGYTRKVEILKADINAGKWVPITTNILAKGEALFLSRSVSKFTRVYGDIKEGFIYFIDIYDVFDTKSWSRRPFRLPRQWGKVDHKLLTWLFPPELVV